MLHVFLIFSIQLLQELLSINSRAVCINKYFWFFSIELIMLLFSIQMFWNSRCRGVTSAIQGNIAGGRNGAAGRKELKMGQLEVSCEFEQV